jgi:hypothetical protein
MQKVHELQEIKSSEIRKHLPQFLTYADSQLVGYRLWQAKSSPRRFAFSIVVAYLKLNYAAMWQRFSTFGSSGQLKALYIAVNAVERHIKEKKQNGVAIIETRRAVTAR